MERPTSAIIAAETIPNFLPGEQRRPGKIAQAAGALAVTLLAVASGLLGHDSESKTSAAKAANQPPKTEAAVIVDGPRNFPPAEVFIEQFQQEAKVAFVAMLDQSEKEQQFIDYLEAGAQSEAAFQTLMANAAAQVAHKYIQAPATQSNYQGSSSVEAFLACTRAHESNSAGGYQAVSPSGQYRGAYQFAQGTWDATAARSGRSDLVGVDPAAASAGDQDSLAASLYETNGNGPWEGRC